MQSLPMNGPVWICSAGMRADRIRVLNGILCACMIASWLANADAAQPFQESSLQQC
jgi:hypothetical protein